MSVRRLSANLWMTAGHAAPFGWYGAVGVGWGVEHAEMDKVVVGRLKLVGLREVRRLCRLHRVSW